MGGGGGVIVIFTILVAPCKPEDFTSNVRPLPTNLSIVVLSMSHRGHDMAKTSR